MYCATCSSNERDAASVLACSVRERVNVSHNGFMMLSFIVFGSFRERHQHRRFEVFRGCLPRVV